jgi:protein TonB
MLLVPAGFLDFLFPRTAPSVEGGLRDLTPDFTDIALSLTPIPENQVTPESAVDVVMSEEVAAQPDEGLQVPSPVGAPTQGSITAGETMPLFPPVPRFIVPPALEDLGISSLHINLRILVNTEGIPEQVILADSLPDYEIRRRVLECAWRFRFQPARRGDVPVASWVELPLVLESSHGR